MLYERELHYPHAGRKLFRFYRALSRESRSRGKKIGEFD